MTDPTGSLDTESGRYQRLVEVLHLALNKARSQVDVEAVVKECYGDENVAVFQSLLAGVLECAQTEVETETLAHFRTLQLDIKLHRLDAAIRKLERDTAAHQREMVADQESAEAALQQARRPEGVTAQDWVQYQAYQRLVEEKRALEKEIDAEEAAVAELEATEKEKSSTTGRRVEEMRATSKELERSADLCSTVS